MDALGKTSNSVPNLRLSSAKTKERKGTPPRRVIDTKSVSEGSITKKTAPKSCLTYADLANFKFNMPQPSPPDWTSFFCKPLIAVLAAETYEIRIKCENASKKDRRIQELFNQIITLINPYESDHPITEHDLKLIFHYLPEKLKKKMSISQLQLVISSVIPPGISHH